MGEVLQFIPRQAEQIDEPALYEAAPRHEGIHAASEFVDRACIEAEAWRLIAERTHMPDVPVGKAERRDNARTALFEALTASGHLSPVEIDGPDVDTINHQVLNRLLNGWSDKLPAHIKLLRFYEICEELTTGRIHTAIAAGLLPEDLEIGVMRDYPELMGYRQAQANGFRPDNKKGFVGTARLRRNPDGSYTRIIEQISRSNGTWYTTFNFLEGCGIAVASGEAPDISALRTQFIYSRRDYRDGVVDVQRFLDQYAGPHIRYGEMKTSAQIPYELLREESREREERLESFIDRLATFEEKLDHLMNRGTITREERDGQFKEEVRQILRAICALAPEYAEDCFGEEAAPYYHHAAALVAQNRLAEAEMILDQGKTYEKPVTLCGIMIDAERAKILGVDVDSTTSLIKEGKENSKLAATIRCIKCKQKVPSKKVVKAESWCCPKCKYEVDICTGAIICPGNQKDVGQQESAAWSLSTNESRGSEQKMGILRLVVNNSEPEAVVPHKSELSVAA
jgi:hypothetical protein